MIRKFYQSVNTIKYSIPMTVLAFIIFAEAYLTTMGKDISALRIALIVTAAALAVVMVFYYRSKLSGTASAEESGGLCKAYEAGGMIDRSLFLGRPHACVCGPAY
jgi:hypothetical protein